MKITTLLLGTAALLTSSCTAPSRVVEEEMHAAGKAFVMGEYWTRDNGNPAATQFETYYFEKDGSFTHGFGYSGGAYYGTAVAGRYEYDAKRGKIKLRNMHYLPGSAMYRKKLPLTSTTLLIEATTDSTTTLYATKKDSVENGLSGQPFKKVVGTTTDQYWYEGWSSSDNAIRFTHFGQATVNQVMDGETEYVCDYQMDRNILYLAVRSATVRTNSVAGKTELFQPAIKTFLRFIRKDTTVTLEKVALPAIMDGTRNWEFKNATFKISNPKVFLETPKWAEYNVEAKAD